MSEVTQEPKPDFSTSQDAVLRDVVRLINTFCCEVPLTVYFGGSIFCGVAIPANAYFSEMSQSLSKAQLKDEKDGPFFDLVKRCFESAKRFVEKPLDASDGWMAPQPSFLHMRDVFQQGTVQLNMPSDFLIRIRLSAIDGFSIGCVTRADEYSAAALSRIEI